MSSYAGKVDVKIRCVIMAGGQGARFWPVSRMARPKQFLSISKDGQTLIQATARRVAPLSPGKDVVVVTNVAHRQMIIEQVPKSFVLAEPVGRNTAASIGLAAVYLHKQDPKTVMMVFPADHFIAEEERLREVLLQAANLAASTDVLVTLGISPTEPNTAYGYIKRGIEIAPAQYKVVRFYEKPSRERAEKYVSSGDFYWNGGIFVWRVDVILAAIKQHMPDLYGSLQTIERAIGTKDEAAVLAEVFPKLESVSIDFGVLELAKNCVVVDAGAIGWNDVGSWDAWSTHFEKDSSGNLLHGDTCAIDSSNCVVLSDSRLLALLGCEDLIVIESKDALLVCPRSRVQDVKKIVEELKSRGRTDLV